MSGQVFEPSHAHGIDCRILGKALGGIWTEGNHRRTIAISFLEGEGGGLLLWVEWVLAFTLRGRAEPDPVHRAATRNFDAD